MNALPAHLQKYIVRQDYEKYTPVDQACWRFIMRHLKSFLSEHAHECYLDGLEKTGVEIDSIPRIEVISKKLEQFGWRALPVSGFIPPAAFMELQSLSILPIASDMRSIDHLLYTPAPDIVHEAAGHAPILIHPEYAHYLKQYAQVAKKALISKEDLDIYEAIRKLSDLKESPTSRIDEIEEAQNNLNQLCKNISHDSEASELSRMNWWTAEYGLIGDIQHPKIFGAGLLSSVGESKWCLSQSVKKIPLTVDCIKTSYDITEPQPQLFVTPDFKTLTKVLEQMANKMAFRVGKLEGVQKAIKAGTVNTVEFNSGIQISGHFIEVLTDEDKKTPIYLRTDGPSQLAYNDTELQGHGQKYHASGFGTVVGFFKSFPDKCPSLLSDYELAQQNVMVGMRVQLEYTSKIKIEGILKNILRRDGKIILLSFENAKVTYFGRALFEPHWGIFDLAVGSQVLSVFGGPADRSAYGEAQDFIAARVPVHHYTEAEKMLHDLYQHMRDLRETKPAMPGELKKSLEALILKLEQHFPADWLLLIEALELSNAKLRDPVFSASIIKKLKKIQSAFPEKKDVIEDGIKLASI